MIPTPTRCASSTVLLCLLFGAVWFCGCSTAVDRNYINLLEPTGDAPPSASTLGPGDRFSIRVYGEDNLGGEFVVSPSGTISFPLAGKLRIDGLTCSEVEDNLNLSLSKGYLRNPSISCSVLESNSKRIYVFGEVKQPGTFPFDDNMTVVQAVTLAGGFSDRAAPNNSTVVRKVSGGKVQARIPMDAIIAGEVENLQLLPGDFLFVPESIY